MKCIAVFCGSSSGSDEIYLHQARRLGTILAIKGIRVVYGGAKVGLMGALAHGVLQDAGHVTGVIPRFLMVKEVVHEHLTELIPVDNMHERKALIESLTDGVIVLPGGFGTLDELFETLTWGQLGLHAKPVGLLNVNGYFSNLMKAIDNMVREGFLKDINRDMLLVSDNIEDLLGMMETYRAPVEQKWL